MSGGRPRGYVCSAETRAKTRAKLIGRKRGSDAVAKKLARYGVPLSKADDFHLFRRKGFSAREAAAMCGAGS